MTNNNWVQTICTHLRTIFCAQIFAHVQLAHFPIPHIPTCAHVQAICTLKWSSLNRRKEKGLLIIKWLSKSKLIQRWWLCLQLHSQRNQGLPIGGRVKFPLETEKNVVGIGVIFQSCIKWQRSRKMEYKMGQK